MKIIELTGEPCAGKSTYLNSLSKLDHFTLFCRQWLLNDLGITSKVNLLSPVIYELYMFYAGMRGIGHSRLFYFWLATQKLNEPVLRRINIFRNIIHKYAIHYRVANSKCCEEYLVVDEGISHIPYLFTGGLDKIETSSLFNFPYEKPWIIKLSLDIEIIISRLLKRGHKRIDDSLESATLFALANRKCSQLQDALLVGYERKTLLNSPQEKSMDKLVKDFAKLDVSR